LLTAMQAVTTAVKPVDLGVIGTAISRTASLTSALN
jgi:hypothetical protein